MGNSPKYSEQTSIPYSLLSIKDSNTSLTGMICKSRKKVQDDNQRLERCLYDHIQRTSDWFYGAAGPRLPSILQSLIAGETEGILYGETSCEQVALWLGASLEIADIHNIVLIFQIMLCIIKAVMRMNLIITTILQEKDRIDRMLKKYQEELEKLPKGTISKRRTDSPPISI